MRVDLGADFCNWLNSYAISDTDFCQAWHAIFCLYGAGIVGTDLPRLNTINPLATLIQNNHQFSLEYLCRMLVPNGYKNTMQATNDFMEINSHILDQIPNVLNPVTGRQVQGARLRSKFGNLANPDVEALFESDIDDLEEKTEEETTDSNVNPSSRSITCGEYIADFVDQINTAPYQPMYRGRAVGTPVTGWNNRLQSYFWPNPRIDLAATDAHLEPILARCAVLALNVAADIPWTTAEQDDAVAVSHDIFQWGGVPQNRATVTAVNVRNVFEAALTGIVNLGTPMNSGWTKVAAFATAHLEIGESTPNPQVQVIWDSRVSTSIIRRLDNIFHNAGLATPPDEYARIGLVPGRGGTRGLPLGLNFRWRNGYGSWNAQFAGSRFIQEVCKCLNSRKIKMTNMAGNEANWTVRGVEMVLFGDGY